MTQTAWTTDTKILELRHSSPYNGCFWEYNYWIIEVTPSDMPDSDSDDPLDSPNNVIACDPIYTSRRKPLSEEEATRYYREIVDADALEAINYDEYMRRSFSSPSIYDLDDDLHTHIPVEWWGSAFKNVTGFSWVCDECGTRQYEAPSLDKWHYDYKGNGGTGVQITEIYCDECANKKEEEYKRDVQKRQWEKQWPDHCWTCEGRGKTDDGDLCPDCIGEGACPRCGEFIGTAYDKPCPSCGFEVM